MDGYAAHLSSLTTASSAIEPHGNLRMSVRKAGFSFPVHRATSTSHSHNPRNPVRKTASLPIRRRQLAVCGPTAAATDEANSEGSADAY